MNGWRTCLCLFCANRVSLFLWRSTYIGMKLQGYLQVYLSFRRRMAAIYRLAWGRLLYILSN